MRNYARLCRHVLVCDVDEFAMPAPGSPYGSLAEALRDVPENVAWVEIIRREFGHRPHETRPKGGVVENYVWRSATLPSQDVEKSVVNGAIADQLSWFRGVHRPRWKLWRWPLRNRGWVNLVDNERTLRVNHYYTKSAEEWKERGRSWDGNTFNRWNGSRVAWRDAPPESYSEVEEDHARVLKAKMLATSFSPPS